MLMRASRTRLLSARINRLDRRNGLDNLVLAAGEVRFSSWLGVLEVAWLFGVLSTGEVGLHGRAGGVVVMVVVRACLFGVLGAREDGLGWVSVLV